MFSYYVGIGGYNQDYRYLDQFNGSNLGDVWGYPIIAYNTIGLYFGGVYPRMRLTPHRPGRAGTAAPTPRRSTTLTAIRTSACRAR